MVAVNARHFGVGGRWIACNAVRLTVLRLVPRFCRLFSILIEPFVVPLVNLLQRWGQVEIAHPIVESAGIATPEVHHQAALAGVEDICDVLQLPLTNLLVHGAVLQVDQVINLVVLLILRVTQHVLEVELVENVRGVSEDDAGAHG